MPDLCTLLGLTDDADVVYAASWKKKLEL